jgi:hypothetical protein
MHSSSIPSPAAATAPAAHELAPEVEDGHTAACQCVSPHSSSSSSSSSSSCSKRPIAREQLTATHTPMPVYGQVLFHRFTPLPCKTARITAQPKLTICTHTSPQHLMSRPWCSSCKHTNTGLHSARSYTPAPSHAHHTSSPCSCCNCNCNCTAQGRQRL